MNPPSNLNSSLLRALVDEADDPIVVLDTDGQFIYANSRAQSFGLMAGEGRVTRPLADNIRESDRARFWGAFDAILAGTHEQLTCQRLHVAVGGDWRMVDAGFRRLATDLGDAVVVTTRDTTREVALERAFDTLTRADRALVQAKSEGRLLTEVCDTIVRTAGYRLAWIGRAERDRSVSVLASAGQLAYLDGIKIRWDDSALGQGPTGRALATKKPQVIHVDDAAYEPWRQRAQAAGFRAACALPFRLGDHRQASLNIYSNEKNAFDGTALDRLGDLVQNLEYGSARLHDAESLQASLTATVTALGAAAELRDPFTAGHQRRVAELCRVICGILDLSDDLSRAIGLAADIHDIGKLGIPIEILTTVVPLTPLQYEFIKGHAQWGADILANVEFLHPIRDFIWQHHERLDGSGYPRGLKQSGILLGSRIVTVADVVESMATRRPYRETPGVDAALLEITTHAGQLYDPDVVAACVVAFREQDFWFRESPLVL